MATTDRRPAPGGLDPKVISATKAEWSSKDTRMFRMRVKQIEQANAGPDAEDGRRKAELVRS